MDLCKVFEDTRNKSNNELKADTEKLINKTTIYIDEDYSNYLSQIKNNNLILMILLQRYVKIKIYI